MRPGPESGFPANRNGRLQLPGALGLARRASIRGETTRLVRTARTSTDFHPYAAYETFPYPEYSEAFFGDEYKVLRGGAWATRFGAIRNTFRNWDSPIRRQIFSGVRCARDD